MLVFIGYVISFLMISPPLRLHCTHLNDHLTTEMDIDRERGRGETKRGNESAGNGKRERVRSERGGAEEREGGSRKRRIHRQTQQKRKRKDDLIFVSARRDTQPPYLF